MDTCVNHSHRKQFSQHADNQRTLIRMPVQVEVLSAVVMLLEVWVGGNRAEKHQEKTQNAATKRISGGGGGGGEVGTNKRTAVGSRCAGSSLPACGGGFVLGAIWGREKRKFLLGLGSGSIAFPGTPAAALARPDPPKCLESIIKFSNIAGRQNTKLCATRRNPQQNSAPQP